jgi:predicted CoA-binding protein
MGDIWERWLLETDDDIGALLNRVQTIAVLGIKDGSDPDLPANFVPAYAQQQGFTIIPVPVYYPGIQRILGQPVYRTVREIPGRVDLVNVFRKAKDIPAHLDDILLARPMAVWFQLGIRNDEAAQRLAQAGIFVVQDRCLQVDLRLWGW